VIFQVTGTCPGGGKKGSVHQQQERVGGTEVLAIRRYICLGVSAEFDWRRKVAAT